MATRSRASRKATAAEVIVVDSDSDASQPDSKRRATASGSAVSGDKGPPSPSNVVDVSSGDEEEEVEVVDVAVKAIFQPCELCNRAEGVRGLGCCHHSICLPCLRIHVQAQTKLAKPLALCPVPKCPSPVLSARDLLMVLPLAEYDAYSKRQLDAFNRLMLQVKNAEAMCPRCDAPCSEGTNFLSTLFKRGQDKGKDNGKRKRSPSSQAETAPSPKDLTAQLNAPPKVLNCSGCSLKFCPMCAPVLGPESINYFNVTRSGGSGGQGKGIKASLNNQRLLSSHGSYCPRMPLYRLHVLSAYTKDLLNEFMRERVVGKKSSSGSSSSRSSWIKGTGFGGSQQSSKSSAAVAKAEQDALKRQQNWDLRFQDALAKWRSYVPTPNTPVTPELQAMLAGGFGRSGPISTPLCLLLRLLLRNDSFLDLSSRRHLYITALDLLTDLSSHMFIAPLLTRPVDELEDDEAKSLDQDGKGKASAAGGGGSGSSSSVDPSSLLGLLDKLKMAALYFQKCGGKAQSTVTAEEEAGFLQDMALSIKISETHEIITKRLNEHTMRWEKEIPSDESKAAACSSPSSSTSLRSPTSTQDRRPTRCMPTRASPAAAVASAAGSSSGMGGRAIDANNGRTPAGAPSSGKGKKGPSSEEKEEEQEREAYAEVMGPLRFEAVPLLHMVESNEAAYTYYQEANGQDGVVGSAQKRLVRVMHEITSLATSLPVEYGAGIFVRVDEERPDVLKALISGPMDTPYANGLFEFDVWLPGSYPDSPPKVHLITTGGGRVRYNPNLYNSGKVCLSLLGTWAGPGWDPKRSTLLQVLVSIQSLILVSDPYFNEPGYEGQMSSAAGKAASEAYNAGVRHGTLRFALLEMMKKPSPVLKDIIERHFSLKRESILRQCEAWVKSAPVHVAGTGNSTGMAGNRAEVEKVAKEIVALLGKMPAN